MLELMQYRDFDQVFMIMEQSFPCDEYRTYEEQKKLLQKPYYRIYVSRTEQCQGPQSRRILAFLAIWELSGFTFIEHLASDPAVRGQGLGAAVLKEAAQLFPGRRCLEVELPETELAKRRIAFYERNGFFLNAYPYVQPAISKGRQEIPLLIMTSGGGIAKGQFAQIRTALYQEVYGQRC